jgi:DNA modification methylase
MIHDCNKNVEAGFDCSAWLAGQPLTLLNGDCRSVLKSMPDESVNCCVTSPPYWGLRDYGVKGQIGLEPNLEEYTATMVAIFEDVRRVLRSDGTLWMNMGDSYNVATNKGRRYSATNNKNHGYWSKEHDDVRCNVPGLKPKDLVGQPWMLAFALRAAGWWLRADIIWHKPNPMPESVTDRPTKSHEYLFLLSKSDRYFYDASAIAEPVMQSSLVRAEAGVAFGGNKLCPDTRLQSGKLWIPKAEGANSRMNRSRDPKHEREYEGKHRSADDQASGRRMLKNVKEARANGGEHDAPFGVTRNKRSVWTVPTAPYKDSHFATFPPDLIKPCILAGCPAGGLVLDPFGGSGTTGMVALELGRRAVLIELNAEYAKLCEQRCAITQGLPLAC